MPSAHAFYFKQYCRRDPFAIPEHSHVSMTLMVIVPERMRLHRKKI